mgnify:CR=1 FL=1
MEKWERYANSLRLRLAMRVATQGVLQEEGRAAIKEMLENPAGYPLIEEQENNIFIINQKSGQLNFTAGSRVRRLDNEPPRFRRYHRPHVKPWQL